jgi:hypothetical protein
MTIDRTKYFSDAVIIFFLIQNPFYMIIGNCIRMKMKDSVIFKITSGVILDFRTIPSRVRQRDKATYTCPAVKLFRHQ